MKTRIASHRGGTLEYGDSTPSGFAATARMAVEEVEFDVHPTADGAIVVHHDATLDRTTDTAGVIAEMTLAQVKRARIDYSPAEAPLTLEELCAIFRPSPVDFRCEIKSGSDRRPYADFVPKVVACLERGAMLERTGFSSFDYETLCELKAASGRPVLWLVSPDVLYHLGLRAICDLARAIGVPELALSARLARAEEAAFIRGEGLDFGVWGAHDRATLRNAFGIGAKVLTSDRPSLALLCRDAFLAEEGRP